VSRHRFRALDGWRGVCAMMVVLFHLDAGTHIHALTRHGYASVDFFFVLSGFVLMSAFETRLTDGASLRTFAARRIMRLYPLHLFALIVLVALVGLEAARAGKPLFADAHGWPALIQGLTLTQGFTVNQLSWNFPSWSISIELWGSLVFGLTLLLARGRSVVVLGIYVLALVATVLVFGEPDGPAVNEGGVLLKDAHYLTGFFAGAILFKVYQWLSSRGFRPPGWTEIMAALLVVGVFVAADDVPQLSIVAIFAVAILVFAFDGGPISRALQTTPFQAFGRWSYSIYLTHPLWTIAIYRAAQAIATWTGRPAFVTDSSGERMVVGGPFVMDVIAAACLALVVATASLTYRFIEQPGQRLVR
jgi:peptidoglycan/LPS O-acetylase OafA/YrhL